MVEQIEDNILSVPCDSINNWYQTKWMFFNAETTLCAHDISKMTAQAKNEIESE